MIDYDKLEHAHRLADKSGGTIHYAYTRKDGTVITWVGLDQLLLEMKELTQPEPKYKVGDYVWRLGSKGYGLLSCTIKDIKDGVYTLSGFSNIPHLEHDFYPTREALIEAQVEYWNRLQNGEKSTDLDEVSMELKLCPDCGNKSVADGICWQQGCLHQEPDSPVLIDKTRCEHKYNFLSGFACSKCGENRVSAERYGVFMNELTKEELQILLLEMNISINRHADLLKVAPSYQALKEKIESMIDNYCEHDMGFIEQENMEMILTCRKCGKQDFA